MIFINRDYTKRHRSKEEARIIASHASGCYRRWEKKARRKIVLDASTQSILGKRKIGSIAPEATLPSPQSLPTPTSSSLTPTSQNDEDVEYKLAVSRLDTYHESLLKTTYDRPFNPSTFKFQRTSNSGWTTMYSDVAYIAKMYTPPPSPDSRIDSAFFDPFTTSSAMQDAEVNSSLHFYFKVIRPFVTHLIPDWHWFDNLAEIQAKPVLAFAVAALASIFMSGCLKGGPGVVLPPLSPTCSQDGLLWPIPPWLRLQSNCIRELNKELKDGEVDEGVFQAVLFLFRLAVLLADGNSARMHLTALQRLEKHRPKKVEMGKELAVLRVNIVAAFLHSSSLLVLKEKRKGEINHLVEIDKTNWGEKIYWNHQASLNGRILTWRAGANEEGRRPGDWIQKECDVSVDRMDPGSREKLGEAYSDVVKCYQSALYFIHYLNAVSYSTSSDGVRSQVQDVKQKLEKYDPSWLRQAAPVTLFSVLMAGAMGSRGKLERPWFIEKLAEFEQMQYMDDVLDNMEKCFDPFGICWTVLEEIWEEVLDWRLKRWSWCRVGISRKIDLYKQNVVRPVEQDRPISYEPDLRVERVIMQREIVEVA
jgi:hypothetical protein